MNDTTNSVTDALSYLAASKSAILSGEPWTPTMQEMYLAAADSLDTLRTQLAETQRDAERWRWLRNHARIFRQSPDMSGNHYWMVQATTTLRGPTLDAAIDAAKGEPS